MHPTRQAGDDHWTRRAPESIRRGPAAPGAKLSAAEIDTLCTAFAHGSRNQSWLARRFNVSRVTIWRHLKARGLL